MIFGQDLSKGVTTSVYFSADFCIENYSTGIRDSILYAQVPQHHLELANLVLV
jgi:hypothetical protein